MIAFVLSVTVNVAAQFKVNVGLGLEVTNEEAGTDVQLDAEKIVKGAMPELIVKFTVLQYSVQLIVELGLIRTCPNTLFQVIRIVNKIILTIL
jgi:hypothetical protein